MKKTQLTEWKVEWIDEYGDIYQVDHADTKNEAMKIITRELEEGAYFHEIHLNKERSYWTDFGNGDGDLDHREVLSTLIFK